MKGEMAIPVNKPMIRIDSMETDDIEGLSIGDEIKVSALGRVIGLSEDNIFTDGEDTGKKKTGASIELSEIELDNVTSKDKSEADADGIKLKDYVKIKKLKERVIKNRDETKQ